MVKEQRNGLTALLYPAMIRSQSAAPCLINGEKSRIHRDPQSRRWVPRSQDHPDGLTQVPFNQFSATETWDARAVAKFAIAIPSFALATWSDIDDKDRAFEASSPKTFKGLVFGSVLFFLSFERL